MEPLPTSDTKINFIVFLECQLQGTWLREKEGESDLVEPNFTTYRIRHKDGGTISIVTPLAKIRHFHFRNDTILRVGQGMIRYREQDLIEEILMDEDKK